MRLGYINLSIDDHKIQTPLEQGREQTEQIMKCIPNRGIIQPYSEVKNYLYLI